MVTFSPSAKYTQETRAITMERRLDITDAPGEVYAHQMRTFFTPVDASFYVRLQSNGDGRWDIYAWGKRPESNGPIHLSTPSVNWQGAINAWERIAPSGPHQPPEWLLEPLDHLLEQVSRFDDTLRLNPLWDNEG